MEKTEYDLVTENMNLVYAVVKRHFPSYLCDEDLIQHGMIGLCQAAKTFDSSKCKFSTYATKCIFNEICKEFRTRNKQPETISMSRAIDDDDDLTIGDIIQGDVDVDYSYVDSYYSVLTEQERKVADLLKSGLSSFQIAEKLGCTNRWINVIRRRIKKKWGELQ